LPLRAPIPLAGRLLVPIAAVLQAGRLLLPTAAVLQAGRLLLPIDAIQLAGRPLLISAGLTRGLVVRPSLRTGALRRVSAGLTPGTDRPAHAALTMVTLHVTSSSVDSAYGVR